MAAATNPTNAKALVMRVSSFALPALIAVAARMSAPPQRPRGRAFDNRHSLGPSAGSRSGWLARCLSKRLFINSASKILEPGSGPHFAWSDGGCAARGSAAAADQGPAHQLGGG